MIERYTIVCEFRGGTYVSQVQAGNEVDALRRWAERIEIEAPIAHSSARIAANTLRDLNNSEVSALDGLVGAWCFSTMVGGSVVLLNLVRSC